MGKIDKIIANHGYYVRRTQQLEWLDGFPKSPTTFIEYVKNTGPEDKFIVQLIISDVQTNEFSIRTLYEAGERTGASGGGREYGTVIYSMPFEELDMFSKKAKELKKQLKRRKFIHNIFGRG